MTRNIQELICASEEDLWAVLNAASLAIPQPVPYEVCANVYSAGYKVIIDRRNRLALSCEALQVSTQEPTTQVSSAWLAQIRTEFLGVHRHRDDLLAAQQWRPMDTAPVDRRIMLKRPRWVGAHNMAMVVGIGRYESQQYHKTPRPYWNDDQGLYSVAENRKSEPVGWREIPQ